MFCSETICFVEDHGFQGQASQFVSICSVFIVLEETCQNHFVEDMNRHVCRKVVLPSYELHANECDS